MISFALYTLVHDRFWGHSDSKATIYDVAKVAGVSPSTVSRAFSQPGRVSFSTAEKIRNACGNSGFSAPKHRYHRYGCHRCIESLLLGNFPGRAACRKHSGLYGCACRRPGVGD
ncbi:LacI family DNA-binding transcriptional regulator [Corynebacterium glutamicum]|nr:LacI family DNA-binding transcriptional regulator [Corynebacterium glutamicum]QXU45201.1 LacI family DNA-binding transcriptional regulator [[Brevibacterium] flavum]